MATFPLLSTGVVAQYPLRQASDFASEEVRFLDGTRQTYSLRSRRLRRWSLRYQSIGEAEAAVLSHFAELYGTQGFDFADPISGSVVHNCRISDNGLELQLDAEGRASASLIIEELP